MVQDHSGVGDNIISWQETTIFANLGGVRRRWGQAFFDCNSGNKKDTVVPPNGHRIFREITEPITTFSSACYRLCVYASGSLIMAILNWFTFIRLSALHFGQNSGKLRSSVSLFTLILVLLLHTGHNIHLKQLLSTEVPAFPLVQSQSTQQSIDLIFHQSMLCAV